MTTTTTEKKLITIVMSERPPVRIDPAVWGLIASAKWFDGQHEVQANRTAVIKVREHEDGRRIVYGTSTSAWANERDEYAGYMVLAGDDSTDETIRAIRRVAGVLGREDLGSDCIADLPAEEL